jgi:hypothetical protein
VASWAMREWRGRAGPQMGGRGREKRKGFFPFFSKTYFLDEGFHNFNQPIRHGAINQNKVLLGFCFTRDLKLNLAIALEMIKA